MAALTADKMGSDEQWYQQVFPLRAGKHAFIRGFAIGNPVSADVVPGVASASQVFLGQFAANIDNTNGTGPTPVIVNLVKERTLLWANNDGSISQANLFQTAYILDDQTVTITSPTGKTALGLIMSVSATDGVLVQVVA